MKRILFIRFQLYSEHFTMQILEQESFLDNMHISEIGPIRIISSSRPELSLSDKISTTDTIYIRGSLRECNDDECKYASKDPRKTMLAVLERMKIAITRSSVLSKYGTISCQIAENVIFTSTENVTFTSFGVFIDNMIQTKPENILSLKFILNETTISMIILNMTEKFRSKSEGSTKCIGATGSFYVHSQNLPALDLKQHNIFLRGNQKKHDLRESLEKFDDRKTAEHMFISSINKLTRALSSETRYHTTGYTVKNDIITVYFNLYEELTEEEYKSLFMPEDI